MPGVRPRRKTSPYVWVSLVLYVPRVRLEEPSPVSGRNRRSVSLPKLIPCSPVPSLQDPPTSPTIDLAEFASVCEDISTAGDHEEYFNKKFDQLEKLHELYKSVSSINAKSQSRLELNRNKTEEFHNQNLLSAAQRSASFSLTGLLGDLDNLSIPSSVSDDLASLCSEPAWVSR